MDFAKFGKKLVGLRHLVRMYYYYNARVDQTKEPQRYSDQQKFFSSLRRVPYLEVKFGWLIYRNWPQANPYEKGVDVRLATYMLTHCFQGNFDTVVLVSGYTDFADAMQAIKDRGKHVEVALFGGGHTSQHLRDVADNVVELDGEFLKDCWK